MKVKSVIDRLPSRINPTDLDRLMTSLEVEFVKLSECLVSPGWRLSFPVSDAVGIHYNLAGMGRMIIGSDPPIDLRPHTLIIVPKGQSFVIEGPASSRASSRWTTVDAKLQNFTPGVLRKFIAGDGLPQIMLICGYFRALCGASVDLFASLPSPIAEYFNAADQLDHKLRSAMDELIAQEVGAKAMTTALLKQVLVSLLRRSLSSTNLWAEQFSILGDAQIAAAFADMVARPDAPHSIVSLSQAAGLSRSAFMLRFTAALGCSPMAVLRKLRMRHATTLLASNVFSIDQIARRVGYANRSSFSRAFRASYGNDPSAYRALAHGRPPHTMDQDEITEKVSRGEA
jgi:AraC-like DNA-binding protein